eukprot:2460155-Pleurochrysis_carterae.AAC.2
MASLAQTSSFDFLDATFCITHSGFHRLLMTVVSNCCKWSVPRHFQNSDSSPATNSGVSSGH